MESASEQQPFIYYLLYFYEHSQWTKKALPEYEKNESETLIGSSRVIYRAILLDLSRHTDALGNLIKMQLPGPALSGCGSGEGGESPCGKSLQVSLGQGVPPGKALRNNRSEGEADPGKRTYRTPGQGPGTALQPVVSCQGPFSALPGIWSPTTKVSTHTPPWVLSCHPLKGTWPEQGLELIIGFHFTMCLSFFFFFFF